MSRTYGDIGAILRSMNYEQRSLTLELVSIVAFSCTTIPGVLLPHSETVDAISESVAEQLDRLSVPDPVDNVDIQRASLKVAAAQMRRDREYLRPSSQSPHLQAEARRFADKRLANAQDELARLYRASA